MLRCMAGRYDIDADGADILETKERRAVDWSSGIDGSDGSIFAPLEDFCAS